MARAQLPPPATPRAGPPRRAGMRLERLLAVTRADLLDPSAEELRGLADLARGPDEDSLRPHLHVDAVEVPPEQPLEQARRQHVLGGRQLRERFAAVPLAVRREVGLVDLGRPLDEHLDAALDPGAGRVA